MARSTVVPTLGVLLVALSGATAAHFYAQPSTCGISPTAVAVHPIYFTVRVENGSPVVAPDVYGLDAPLAEGLGPDLPPLTPMSEAVLIADTI